MGCICTPDPRSEIRRPNAYVIDVYNERMSGENRLGAIQKTALIGATLLIEFAYYLPQPIPRDRGGDWGGDWGGDGGGGGGVD